MTLPTNSGSVENRNDSARHGWTRYSRHALATVASEIPSCRASSRVDQCVTASLFGGGRNVAVMIAAWSIERAGPTAAHPPAPPSRRPGNAPASRVFTVDASLRAMSESSHARTAVLVSWSTVIGRPCAASQSPNIRTEVVLEDDSALGLLLAA